jgi:hypothetical protein
MIGGGIVKGVIMESNKNTAIVLDEKGCFRKIKVRGQNLEVGQEIKLDQFSKTKTNNYFNALKTVAAILVIAILTTVPIYYNSQLDTHAYITIDINPSIELALNSRGKVLKVSALNNDADILIKDLKLKNMTCDEAILLITDKAQNLDYIKEDNNDVFITAVVKNTNIKDTVAEGLVKAIEKTQNNPSSSAAISVLEAKVQERTEAQNSNISVGKYISMKKLQDKDINVTLEDMNDKGIGQIIKENGSKAKDAITEQRSNSIKDGVLEKVKDKINNSKRDKENIKDKTQLEENPYDEGEPDNTNIAKDNENQDTEDKNHINNNGQIVSGNAKNSNTALEKPNNNNNGKDAAAVPQENIGKAKKQNNNPNFLEHIFARLSPIKKPHPQEKNKR